MARVELPPSQLRARKRRRRVHAGVMLGVFAWVLLAACVASAQSAVVRISAIQVTGAQTISSSTIGAQVREALLGYYAWVIPRNTIFVYPKGAISRELLATYPALSDVEVHAVDFHTIAVAVVERAPRALWCPQEGGCYFMDENGVIYAPAPVFSVPVYTQYYGAVSQDALPKQFLTPGDFVALSALVDAIAQKVATATGALSDVTVDGNLDVTMRFAAASPAGGQGFALRFALHDQGGDVFERFTLALTAGIFKSHRLSDFEYLDLRFGDKLYYKLK